MVSKILVPKRQQIYESQVQTQRESVKQATDRFTNDLDRELQLYGTDTGHHELNLIINGWVPGKITSYALRPSQGKTLSVVQMMKSAGVVHNNKRSQLLFLTWEMSAKDLVNRCVSHETGLTATQLKYPKLLTPQQRSAVSTAYKNAQSFPVEYHQMPTNVSGVIPILEEFCQRTRERSEIEGRFIQPVMALDFISMLKGGSATNRTYQIGEFTQTLKNTAEKEGLACFLLQQLNRSADNKDVPDITDISDSQAIEQNSDTVIIGHRPEQLNRLEIVDPSTGTTMPSKGKMLWRVMKNREGSCGDIILNIDAARNRMWSEGMEWNTPYQHLYNDEQFWKNRFS